MTLQDSVSTFTIDGVQYGAQYDSSGNLLPEFDIALEQERVLPEKYNIERMKRGFQERTLIRTK